jgi:hypothetical protein
MNRTLLLGLALLTTTVQADCGYRALAIEPETSALYVGAGERVRVEFDNYRLDGEVDSFPEPPLRISQNGVSCKVDGGIWLRKGVYLDVAERHLLVQSFSGSGGELTVYDTASCAELARIELPEASWAVQGEQLLVGRQCTGEGIAGCALRDVHALDEQCLPSL